MQLERTTFPKTTLLNCLGRVTVTIRAEFEGWSPYTGNTMAVAAVTPRVRTIVICDEVTASLTEPDVFTLDGVRLRLEAASVPCLTNVSVFLLLASPRRGSYSGKLVIVNDRTDRAIRYVKLMAKFGQDSELLPLVVEIAGCEFPAAGLYRFEVYFSARGNEALKGEHPFHVTMYEE